MRIHQLELTDVGPFVGTVTIDFATLASSGLFLLEGPTGSGKSTILDAIVFALYGQVGGPHASSDRMRSHANTGESESVVSLVFETASGIFRIRRTPQFERPKRKGSGVTTQQATVKLWRLCDPESDAGELLSSRHGEVEDEIYRHVGLTRAQFLQTVILPQGEFANFLRAKPEQRKDLLQRLFDTELFEHLTVALEQQRRTARLREREADDRVARALAGCTAVLELDEDACHKLEQLPDEELVQQVSGHVDELHERVARARSARNNANEQLAVAEQVLRDASEYRTAWIRHSDLLAQRDVLLAESESVRKLGERIAQFDRACATLELFGDLNESQATVERLSAILGRDDVPDESSIDGVIGTLEVELERLRGLSDIEQRVNENRELLETAQTAVAQLRQQAEELASRQTAIPEIVAELQRQLTAREVAGAKLDRLKSDLESVRQSHAAAIEADRIAARLVDAEQAASAAVREASALNDELHRRQQQRIDLIAGELASTLRPGEACPVCGSAEHPAPTPVRATQITREQLAALAEQVQRAVAAADSSKHVVDGLRLDYARARSASHDIPGSQWEAEIANLTAQVQSAEHHVAAVEQLRRDIDLHTNSLQRVAEKLAVVHEQIVQLTARIAALVHSIDTDSEQLSATLEESGGIANRLEATRERLATLNSARSQQRELAQAAHRYREIRRQWTRALADLGLASDSEYEHVVNDRHEIDEIRARVNDHNAKLAAVTGAISGEERDLAVEPLTTDALQELADRRNELAGLREEAEQLYGHRNQQLESAARHLSNLRTAVDERVAITQRTSEVIRMADVASATSPENRLHLPLATYVLLERFKEVLAAANSRLRAMSNGRFDLEHHIELEGRGRKSGLGITVRDHFTGTARAAGDLSGGETFYTALALALGLADVVVAENGGIDLGMLFIDEGFGSLDSDALDLVLDEIDKLRSGGRIVGLVSHVEELKQRIAERIEVRPHTAGTSRIRVLA